MASSNRGDLNIGNRKHHEHHLPYLLSPFQDTLPSGMASPAGSIPRTTRLNLGKELNLVATHPLLRTANKIYTLEKQSAVERRLVCDKFGARHPNDCVLTFCRTGIYMVGYGLYLFFPFRSVAKVFRIAPIVLEIIEIFCVNFK